MHIGDKIVKFPDNDDRIYLSKPDKNFIINVAEEGESKMIERLNRFKNVWGGEGLANAITREYFRQEVFITWY